MYCGSLRARKQHNRRMLGNWHARGEREPSKKTKRERRQKRKEGFFLGRTPFTRTKTHLQNSGRLCNPGKKRQQKRTDTCPFSSVEAFSVIIPAKKNSKSLMMPSDLKNQTLPLCLCLLLYYYRDIPIDSMGNWLYGLTGWTSIALGNQPHETSLLRCRDLPNDGRSKLIDTLTTSSAILLCHRLSGN